MPNQSTRAGAGSSWPLRVGLGLCVTALVIVGFQLKHDHRSPAASTTTLHATPTTRRRATTSNGPSSSTTRQHRPHNPRHVDEFATALRQHDGIQATRRRVPILDGRADSRYASNDTTTTSATTTTTPALSAIGHCTVLEIGDSLGNDIGWGLARQLGHDHDCDSCRPTVFDRTPHTVVLRLAEKREGTARSVQTATRDHHLRANDEQNLRVNGQVWRLDRRRG